MQALKFGALSLHLSERAPTYPATFRRHKVHLCSWPSKLLSSFLAPQIQFLLTIVTLKVRYDLNCVESAVKLQTTILRINKLYLLTYLLLTILVCDDVFRAHCFVVQHMLFVSHFVSIVFVSI